MTAARETSAAGLTPERVLQFADARLKGAARARVIELAGHWKHGYIPLDEIAWAIKMKKQRGDGKRRRGIGDQANLHPFRPSSGSTSSAGKSRLDPKGAAAHAAITSGTRGKARPPRGRAASVAPSQHVGTPAEARRAQALATGRPVGDGSGGEGKKAAAQLASEHASQVYDRRVGGNEANAKPEHLREAAGAHLNASQAHHDAGNQAEASWHRGEANRLNRHADGQDAKLPPGYRISNDARMGPALHHNGKIIRTTSAGNEASLAAYARDHAAGDTSGHARTVQDEINARRAAPPIPNATTDAAKAINAQVAKPKTKRAPSAAYREYQAARQEQDRRFEAAGVGGPGGITDTRSQEYQQYFGLGEHAGSGKEERVTWAKWQADRRAGNEHNKRMQAAHDAGVKLGLQHGYSSGAGDTHEAEFRAAASGHDGDAFHGGYTDGLIAGATKRDKEDRASEARLYVTQRSNAIKKSERANGSSSSDLHTSAGRAHLAAGQTALAAGDRNAAQFHIAQATHHKDKAAALFDRSVKRQENVHPDARPPAQPNRVQAPAPSASTATGDQAKAQRGEISMREADRRAGRRVDSLPAERAAQAAAAISTLGSRDVYDLNRIANSPNVQPKVQKAAREELARREAARAAGSPRHGLTSYSRPNLKETHPVGMQVDARQPGIDKVTPGVVTQHLDNGMVEVGYRNHRGDFVRGTFNPHHVTPAHRAETVDAPSGPGAGLARGPERTATVRRDGSSWLAEHDNGTNVRSVRVAHNPTLSDEENRQKALKALQRGGVSSLGAKQAERAAETPRQIHERLQQDPSKVSMEELQRLSGLGGRFAPAANAEIRRRDAEKMKGRDPIAEREALARATAGPNSWRRAPSTSAGRMEPVRLEGNQEIVISGPNAGRVRESTSSATAGSVADRRAHAANMSTSELEQRLADPQGLSAGLKATMETELRQRRVADAERTGHVGVANMADLAVRRSDASLRHMAASPNTAEGRVAAAELRRRGFVLEGGKWVKR